jgi:hypothetical protein
MKRSVFSILVLLALFAGLFGYATPAFAIANTISTPPTIGVVAGSNFSIPVTIDTGTGKILGWGFNLSWNPAVLSLTSWTEGAFIKDQAVAAGGDTFRVGGTISNPAGTLTGAAVAALGFPAGQGATGTGTIAVLNFHAIADGNANLAFSGTEVRNELNNLATYSFAPGALRVGAAPSLAVQSIVFTPASGSMTTSAVVTIKNNGSAMSVPADNTVVTLAMNNATPASQTTTISGLAAGATQAITVAYTVNAGFTSTHLTVTDSVYGINTGADYFASVSDIDNTNVDAKFDTFIILTTDANVNFYPLALGLNTRSAGMNVKSNAQAWTVGASASNAGNLKEWNGTAYGTRQLIDKLFVGQSKRAVVSLNGATGVLIPDGVVANQSADAGEDYVLEYAQTLHAGDAALTAPNTYHAVVTYTAAVSF